MDRLLSSISAVRPAARASARLNGSRGSDASRFRAGTNMKTILSAPGVLAAVVNTICWEPCAPVSDRRESSQDGSHVLRSRQRHSLAVSRRQTQMTSAEDQAGAVSERMSIRQPVSRAASRAFWPSRPMASDS